MSPDESLETLLGTAARLRPDLPVEVVAGSVGAARVGRLVDDSRQVIPGAGFVARPGTVSDGRLHILDAIERMDYDVFNRRAYVSRFSKFADLPRSFVLAQAR